MSYSDLMLILVWLLEQGVWVAPLLAIGLYFGTPKRERGWWSTTAVWALGTIFVANTAGVYPGPARVSCAGLPPVCTETIAGAEHAGGEGRARRYLDEPGSAEVDLPLSPPTVSGGSLNRAGAASMSRYVAPARPAGR